MCVCLVCVCVGGARVCVGGRINIIYRVLRKMRKTRLTCALMKGSGSPPARRGADVLDGTRIV